MSLKQESLDKIVKQIEACDIAYYNTGDSPLEDAAYDALKDKLLALEPNHPLLKRVGAPASGILEKRNHTIPMGSQNKAMDRADFEAWLSNTLSGRKYTFHASYKMDGGSVSLEFNAGVLKQAITRGDGLVGEDITANARQFQQIPAKAGKFTGFVRGEIILSATAWEKLDPEQLTNPRNLGNGISRRKDGEEVDNLEFHAFNAFDMSGNIIGDTEEENSKYLTKLGFSVAPNTVGTAEEVWDWFVTTGGKRAKLPFWIDGVVLKINNIQEQRALGASDNRPKGQIALKFKAEVAEATLLGVELTVGHTGAIIPTGKFTPVKLGGTTVQNAQLCNWDVIEALDIAIGDKIEVCKAGEIIPKILSVTGRPSSRKSIPRPTSCPVCSGKIGQKKNISGEESAAIFCLNDDCSAKVIGKLKKYVTAHNILGLGDSVLELLIEQGVADPADLYSIDAKELAESKMGGNITLGEKRATNIIENIFATKEQTLKQFLGALGIEGLGSRMVENIQEEVPGEMDELSNWTSGKLLKLAVQAKVPNVALKIQSGINARKPLIEKLINAGITLTKPKAKVRNTNSKSFCITGSHSKPRDELIQNLEATGHVFKDTVSSGVDYLLIEDPTSTSSKAVKARKLGIKCISEAEFEKIIS